MADAPSARVGRNVAAEMRRNGVTQVEIAKLLGLSQPAISARLNGRISFDVDELHAVAGHLHVAVADLLPDVAEAAS